MTGEIEPYTRITPLGPDQWAVSTHVDLLGGVLAEMREQRGIRSSSAVVPVPGSAGQVMLTVRTLPEVQRRHVVEHRRANPYLVAAAATGGAVAVGLIAWAILAHLAVVAVVVAVVALVGTRRPVRRCITRITVEHRH